MFSLARTVRISARSFQFAPVVNSNFARLASSARVKLPAPKFSADVVVNSEFGRISLDDYKGKWVVLFFYPLDFTFVCPTEIIEFSERSSEFKALGAEVIGASVDSKHSHLAWINQPRKEGGLGYMKIPLIADITKKISKDYGVLIEEGPDAGIALRGTFIIDPKGILRQATINDLPIGRNVDETIRLLEALQFNEQHGEVCPSGWKKGALTMKDNPTDSKAYFKEVYKNQTE
ncbi:Peroxiredoxin-2 [Nowakowskiella sp. JEL0078]|nr:Peroxiredoxin-2 [Nowakowskiella sp. JEL0078]